MVCLSHSSLYAPNNLYLVLIVAFNKKALLFINIVDYNDSCNVSICMYIVDIYLLCMIKFRVR